MKETKIKNLDAAAKRIKTAIAGGENIIVYGDTDLDGVCAAIMVGEMIKNAGGETAAYYFPDREKEGYGITKIALENWRAWRRRFWWLLIWGSVILRK